MAFNIVEAIQEPDADCAFDQPCRFGHRVEGHAVYCHNDAWGDCPRKCRRSWYTGGEIKDEDCPGFQPNPDFKGTLQITPVAPPLCSKCSGTKLIKTDRNAVETCRNCMGDGSEPTAIEMTTYEQDTLELGSGHSGRHSAQRELYVRMVEGRAESSALERLSELSLIEIRSMTFSRSGATAFLIRLTGKGDAVMRANWAKHESDNEKRAAQPEPDGAQ